ncbi:DNA alkylation repair protein [Hydrogenophaga sp.]|uniref:DNA alkylation repair protein n=1 Tax=Hydrogenophaga sp. TaxID=1904254 RepID=UPI00262E39F1|nr:DNA alkylation repair protein [Hydrogenophaga sp.]MDM7951245.1 DNA alkylation repair protein [Hydrogenophaga sp.]
MAEAFKHLINPQTVHHAGEHLQTAWSSFDRTRFEHLALQGLDGLEFKARAQQIANALEACLPSDFDQAAAVLEQALAPPLELDARGEPIGLGAALHPAGLAGWILWGAGEWVARRGMGDVPRALTCLHALTQRFTAEFAIRPFIAAHPSEVFETLARWTHDASPHVRRLVSEGSRPRLPWGLRLQALVADPEPTLPLLQALQDDSSAYVRRSVANHLNDIAKDHPGRIAQWLREHLPGASAERTSLLRHASRGLIKQGHAPTLQAWGLAPGLRGHATLSLSHGALCIGDTLTLSVQLQGSGREPQALVVDYAVHHVRAGGKTSAKVFKGWKVNLAPGEALSLSKRHPFREVTTRRLYPGVHRIELLVNGERQACATVDLHPGAVKAA